MEVDKEKKKDRTAKISVPIRSIKITDHFTRTSAIYTFCKQLDYNEFHTIHQHIYVIGHFRVTLHLFVNASPVQNFSHENKFGLKENTHG